MRAFVRSAEFGLLFLLGVTHVISAAERSGLEQVVGLVEAGGYENITDVECKDGTWEVDASRGGATYEVRVNLVRGAIASDRRDQGDEPPPRKAKKLSQILATVVGFGFRPAYGISLEGGCWELEAWMDDVLYALRVDPVTAEILEERRLRGGKRRGQ